VSTSALAAPAKGRCAIQVVELGQRHDLATPLAADRRFDPVHAHEGGDAERRQPLPRLMGGLQLITVRPASCIAGRSYLRTSTSLADRAHGHVRCNVGRLVVRLVVKLRSPIVSSNHSLAPSPVEASSSDPQAGQR